MKVFIAGVDGYLGWSFAQYLAARGHTVSGLDLGLRRAWVDEMGGISAIPIASMEDRLAAFERAYGTELTFVRGDLRDAAAVEDALRQAQPDAVVQLGECPSAPYSMIDRAHAVFVQTNNIVGTFNLMFAMQAVCPEAHLLKLGTMGEYGTPDVDIPEGSFEVEFRGRRDRLPFPRQAGSWYHWSKVHGSNNIMFACRLWHLRATDVMQGVVFGSHTPEMLADPRLATRLDFDHAFGTAVNRFCCQAAIGHELTVYGGGRQRRGFLPLGDSMRCLLLALEHPPRAGEYRVFNQFESVYGIAELAEAVSRAARALGIDAPVARLDNPRLEAEEHYYNPDCHALRALGYEPTRDVEAEIRRLLGALLPHRDRIAAHRHVLLPQVQWRLRPRDTCVVAAP